MSLAVPRTYKNKRSVWTEERLTGTFGTIAILTNERGTYAQFWNDLMNTAFMMIQYNPRNRWATSMGVDVCGQLNSIIRGLKDDEFVWIMGDDHAFDWDLLPRLLAHDVDVVVPHCLRRNPPWHPVVNSHQNEDGWYVGALLPESGLTQIWSAGSAGMLVKRHVLDAIGDPWFTPAQDAQGLNEDMEFCRKVREAGFSIWCDPSALLGHISNYTVWPRWDGGHWELDAVFDRRERVAMYRPRSKAPA